MTNALALALFLAGTLAAATTGSCSEASPTNPSPAAEFKLKVGQSASLPDNGPSVTFIAVTADSRCPTGVQCIWAGEVKIALDAAQSGQEPTRLELTLGQDPANATAALDGHTLHLLAVNPYPKAGVQIPPDQYEATLRAEKN